jgi:hypothetical protein
VTYAAVETVSVICPNCHGKGFVTVPTTQFTLPCFVCDEDGRIEWNSKTKTVDIGGTDFPADDVTGPSVEERDANADVAEGDKDAKCDNHPQRKARHYTGGGSYSVNLCDECAPPWFTEE